MTTIFVIAILATMAIPVVAGIKARLEQARCIANLNQLHVAAVSYVQDHNSWPQVQVPPNSPAATVANAWIPVFMPYGLMQPNWICPTIQRLMGNPVLTNAQNARIDYTPYPFGPRRQQPFESFKTSAGGTVPAPWFFENANAHGAGQLIIFSDGHVQSLLEFQQQIGH